MGPLTDSAKETLATIARFVGEPGGVFDAVDIAGLQKHRHLRGIKGFTLPALERRGYIKNTEPRLSWWILTNAGWDKAMEITGGKGLL